MNIENMIQGNPQALVKSVNGIMVADSLQVADSFGKQHSHVLRAIESLITSLSTEEAAVNDEEWMYKKIAGNSQSNFGLAGNYFIPDTYADKQGKERKHYWLTRDGFSLLEDHNITLGDGYLRLVYQMVDDNGTPFRDELKTDLSRRSLMITEEMVLLLIFWRLIQNTEKRKAAERGIEYNPDNLVFCTRKGTYIYPRNFTKMWSENLRSMGIDHKRFHDLRHTVATVMLEDGEAMNTVQEQLGHYDAGFTASRYGHVTAKMRNSAAVKLGERLEKVRNPEAEDEEDANSVKKEDTVIPFQEGRKLKSAACKIK